MERTNELWRYSIILWIVLNISLIFVPALYLAIFPYVTMLVAAMFLAILVMKVPKLNPKLIMGIVFLYGFLICLLILLGKSFMMYLTILSSPLAVLCMDKFSFTHKEERFISKFFLVTWILLAVLSVGYFNRFESGHQSVINSNTMGMFLLNITIYLVYFVNRDKRIRSKARYKVLYITAALIALAFGYQARGCMLALLFFAACCIFEPIVFRTRNTPMILSLLIAVAGAAVPFVYMSLINRGILGEVRNSAKSAYTRVTVWSEAVDTFSNNKRDLIFGLPNDVLERVGSALHNNSMEIVAYIGIAGFVMYFAFMIVYMRSILHSRTYARSNNCLIMGFMSLLVLGFTEVSMFWAVTYVMNYLFLGLASGNNMMNEGCDFDAIGTRDRRCRE